MKWKIFSCLMKTQNLDLKGQFEGGIRSFDLRIGDKGPKYSADERFVIIHDCFDMALSVAKCFRLIRSII